MQFCYYLGSVLLLSRNCPLYDDYYSQISTHLSPISIPQTTIIASFKGVENKIGLICQTHIEIISEGSS